MQNDPPLDPVPPQAPGFDAKESIEREWHNCTDIEDANRMRMRRPHAALILFALAGTAGIGAANHTVIAKQSEGGDGATERSVQGEGTFGRVAGQIKLDPHK